MKSNERKYGGYNKAMIQKGLRSQTRRKWEEWNIGYGVRCGGMG